MTVDATQEDILEDLRRVNEIVGRGPSKKEYNEHGKYSYYILSKKFDGLNDAREQAGLDNSDTQRAKPVPKEDLLEAIHNLREELGRVPKREEMVSEGRYSEDPYRRVFNTWSEAVQAAGYKPHRMGKTVSEKVDVTCAWCGIEKTKLESRVAGQENYFCSRKCKSEWQAENVVGEDHHQYEKLSVECAWCGSPVERKPAVMEQKERAFCDKGCYSEWCSYERTGEDHPRFKGGGEVYRGPNWRVQRRKARERDDHTCQRCGCTRSESKEKFNRALDVHHITPLRDFHDSDGEIDWEKVNGLENLVTLCLPCHRKVEKLPVTPEFS